MGNAHKIKSNIRDEVDPMPDDPVARGGLNVERMSSLKDELTGMFETIEKAVAVIKARLK